jgi:ABC-type transport system involved in multi-copper enzyme maturation permease subunit
LEVLRGSRRGHLDVLRRVYAGWLVVQFAVLFFSFLSASSLGPDPTAGWVFTRAFSRWVNSYVELFVFQHFLLLVLATPAFVAGAVAEDKARGTLQHLLLADVSSWEIVAGKALGRVAQVGLVALAGLPMISLTGGFGHLEGVTLLALAGVSVAPLFALGAVSILASVWSVRARDAVLKVYLWLAVGFAAVWAVRHYVQATVAPQVAYFLPLSGTDRALWRLDQVLACLNPVHVLEPSWGRYEPELVARRLALATLAWGLIGVVCLGLAVWRLRPAYLRQLDVAGRRKGGRAPARPAVGDDALRWKEYEIEGLAIFPRLRRLPRWLVEVGIALMTFGSSFTLGPVGAGLLGLFIFSLVAGIRSSGAISGERERQTWDLLLMSPLEPRDIVWGKFRGIRDSLRPYLWAFAVPLLGTAVFGTGGADLVTLIILLVMTFISIYSMSALGLLWSARCQTSWRSLLVTLAAGYAFLLLALVPSLLSVWCITIPITAILFMLPGHLASALYGYFVVGLGFIICLYYFHRHCADTWLHTAEKWIAVRERIWSDDNRLRFLESEFRRLSEGRNRQEAQRTG